MELAINVQVEELPEGLFLATSNELPGLVAQGPASSKRVVSARDRRTCLRPRYSATIRSWPPPEMGRLAGFRCWEIVRKLKTFGFQFDKQAAGRHEI